MDAEDVFIGPNRSLTRKWRIGLKAASSPRCINRPLWSQGVREVNRQSGYAPKWQASIRVGLYQNGPQHLMSIMKISDVGTIFRGFRGADIKGVLSRLNCEDQINPDNQLVSRFEVTQSILALASTGGKN